MITTFDITDRTGMRPDHRMTTIDFVQENSDMLLYEDLARVRMREAERDAAERRQARQLINARRWRRIAVWSARRAVRAERALQPGLVPVTAR